MKNLLCSEEDRDQGRRAVRRTNDREWASGGGKLSVARRQSSWNKEIMTIRGGKLPVSK
jgi:hypothetical protein